MNERPGKWILDEHGEPKPIHDLLEWAVWFGTADSVRRVAREKVGDSEVSTVFLGLDHCYGEGDPVFWETMVFGGKLNQEQDRCGGRRQNALDMHAKMVARVKEES